MGISTGRAGGMEGKKNIRERDRKTVRDGKVDGWGWGPKQER